VIQEKKEETMVEEPLFNGYDIVLGREFQRNVPEVRELIPSIGDIGHTKKRVAILGNTKLDILFSVIQ